MPTYAVTTSQPAFLLEYRLREQIRMDLKVSLPMSDIRLLAAVRDFDLTPREAIPAMSETARAWIGELSEYFDLEVFQCEKCEEWESLEESWTVDSGYATVCEDCLYRYYTRCRGCGEYVRDLYTYTINGDEYCEGCRESFAWCEDCNEYYDPDYSDHCHEEEGCDCVARDRDFQFPASEPIANDERVMATLPAGMIGEEGIHAVRYLVMDWAWTNHSENYDLRVRIGTLVADMDRNYITREGKFPKRLARTFHKSLGIKLPDTLIEQVGNLVSQYTAREANYFVELTRELNGSAEEFGNEESCWFGSGTYSSSLCALKHWGGMAIRSYYNEDCPTYDPSGRAWIQPLDKELTPTSDLSSAVAYAVYNGYGNLSGYTGARIVAQWLGVTYKKISLRFAPQYINGNSGYLVASSELLETVDFVEYEGSYDTHTYR